VNNMYLLEQGLLNILYTKVLAIAVADLSGRLYLVDFLVGVLPIYRFQKEKHHFVFREDIPGSGENLANGQR
jgi:hypothetical protein